MPRFSLTSRLASIAQARDPLHQAGRAVRVQVIDDEYLARLRIGVHGLGDVGHEVLLRGLRQNSESRVVGSQAVEYPSPTARGTRHRNWTA